MNMKKAAMFGLDARIALAIFGALSIISGAALYSAIQQAKITALYNQLIEVAKAYESYYIDTGVLLPMVDAFTYNGAELLINTSNVSNWKGPYLSLEWDSTVSKFKSSSGIQIEITSFESDDWGLTSPIVPDISCDSGDNCSVWISAHQLPASMAINIDSNFDDGIDSTGSIRRFPGGTGKQHIWLKEFKSQ